MGWQLEEQGAHRVGQFKMREVIEYRVCENIEGRGPGGEEGPPPPIVILAAQLRVAEFPHAFIAVTHSRKKAKNKRNERAHLEVAENYGDFGASEGEDEKDYEKDAEDVVNLRGTSRKKRRKKE